ncbi:molybdopterin converting factor subunit 1 [Nitrogeniibacter mangrovi]|uniref:Molybdopterin synthase sulfur carrier subunit n=1 Tax=Nitrogeniibacter mangrovi TaxID=2016596 RepID=A0A6C1B3T8_9RHOO|nr:molybdopterin converting factor subunit 1 [Nitrogeniibacter mangrovi]QID17659.1 molybdopterin converting factor subunit 1 [Nitrogeniibacter mangrovi]
MSIELRYFASLREALGQADETLELPAGVDTVGALRAHLAARGETWARLAPGHNVRAAVNHAMVGDDAAVQGGDEVAFFPPVTGG